MSRYVAHVHYTVHEVRLIRLLLSEGFDVHYIAEYLNRSVYSVSSKIHAMRQQGEFDTPVMLTLQHRNGDRVHYEDVA